MCIRLKQCLISGKQCSDRSSASDMGLHCLDRFVQLLRVIAVFDFYFKPCFPVAIINNKNLDPVVQSIVNLTSSLVVKILPDLVNTISNSHVFWLKKSQ